MSYKISEGKGEGVSVLTLRCMFWCIHTPLHVGYLKSEEMTTAKLVVNHLSCHIGMKCQQHGMIGPIENQIKAAALRMFKP